VTLSPTRRAALGIGAAVAVMALLWLAVPLPEPLFANRHGTVVLDRNGEILHTFLADDQQWRLPLEDQDISPKVVAAVQAFEDRRFFHHPGVDPIAIARAIVTRLDREAVPSGASTLTMQVARLMRPKPRTVVNKLLEMAQALKLETLHSKQEILRLYLGHAPYGGNLVGISAASLHYFGRPPSRLTWAEAATLAVLPNAPARITPARNRDRLKQRRDNLLRRLAARGLLDETALREALAETLPSGTGQPPPRLAPHLSRRLARAEPGTRIRTTLSRPAQEGFEALAARHHRWLARRGIHNLAIVAADVDTGEVVAAVGSPDFFDGEHGGQVDGLHAPRSTGSILKPFLYAQALDAGLIHPDTLLEDVPVHFGRYAPVNADHRFRGVVPASEALVRSLNVPPTLLLERVGVPEFHRLLTRAGMTTLFREPSGYGLSLGLGGAEGTLWDIVAMYRGLARMGRFGDLTLDPEVTTRDGVPLLSPHACRTVLDILTAVRRPDDDGVDRSSFGPRQRVAWKTGTSFGKRDGWAVGVTPRWVVGVWVGNFSGEGHEGIGGAAAAAPVLFAAFDLLDDPTPGRWFLNTVDTRSVRLCAATGYRAGPDCPETVLAVQPRSAPPLPRCPYHRAYWVDRDHGWEVCSRCWGDASQRERVVRLILPPSASAIVRASGDPVDEVPAHNPDCRMPRSGRPLRLIYPAPDAVLVIPRTIAGERQRVTARAAHTTADAHLFWYLNGRYLGRTAGRHQLPLDLDAGDHVLQIVDDAGRAASCRFAVAPRG
jgi:penicillin-binding protein 1C